VNPKFRLSNYFLNFSESILARVAYLQRATWPKLTSIDGEQYCLEDGLVVSRERTVYKNAASVGCSNPRHSYSCENALPQSDKVVEDLAGDVSTRLPLRVRRVVATLCAAVLFLASLFNSPTWVAVQARRFFAFLAILVSGFPLSAQTITGSSVIYAATGKQQFITRPYVSQPNGNIAAKSGLWPIAVVDPKPFTGGLRRHAEAARHIPRRLSGQLRPLAPNE
jgi:hypothetical protein